MSNVTLLELFLEFLKIGFFMFGGGYGGIALMYKELVEIKGWVSDEEFTSLLGVAESTPGPIAINSATWIGYSLGGLPGSILATMGVVLPAYLVILAVVTSLRPYMSNEVVKIVFRGINAAVVALILYAFIKVAKSTLLTSAGFSLNLIAFAIFIVAFILLYIGNQHPIIVIIVSALVSVLLKYVFGI
ncbi:MAG: chromate transporter [Desulfurococcus sp.]|uniref:chromate transporter n=1 Tax=Desulfurococcus sp. TaxID=51678 RepID=UPI003169E5F3